MQKLLIFSAFIFLILFTRLYNLDGTARFTRDESSDLARMHEYYQNKQISLVGPISSEGDKVFSSLSYYMILPFAVLFNFTPVSPVYGMAFLGILTAGLLFLIARSVNQKKIYLVVPLLIIWFPLLEVSRWAWNPHFVIFWAALAVLLYQYRTKIGSFSYLFIGIALGAMFHHHYVALFSTAPFLFFISLPYLRKKQFKEFLLLVVGYLLPYLIFVLFDLKNPPGLFFGRYLLGGNTPHIESQFSIGLLFEHFTRNCAIYLETFVKNSVLQIIFAASVILLIIKERKKYLKRTLTWVVPATLILFAGVFLANFELRYVYSSIVFLLVWLLFPRKEKSTQFLSTLALVVLIIDSVFTIKPQLTTSLVQPNMRIVTQASQVIIDTIHAKGLNNANVAALSSPDAAPLAEKYRDYIRMKNTGLRAPSEYDVSEHLFVVSTASNEVLRADESYAMSAFKDKELKEVFIIDSQWKVFWYGTN